MIKEEFEKEAEESCLDCFCEDCTKDCRIKKLGLVKTREMTDEETMEQEANTFAAAFLMPEKLFTQVWKEKDGHLLAVAERFKVSPTAVKWRAVGLGLSRYE